MKKIYVGNLPFDVTEDELCQLFAQCGQVGSSQIITDKQSGRSKGFGFVEMINDAEADHAVERMQGTDLRGRPLTVDFAKDRQGPAHEGQRAERQHAGNARGGNYKR